MSTGFRPGGLTVLAVLNFIYGGYVGLKVLILVAVFGFVNQMTGGMATEELAKTPEGSKIIIGLGVMVVVAILLIMSGVGYLNQKRFLGRILGSLYGVVAIASVFTNVFLLEQEFEIKTIVDVIYPVLTVLLLNTTFRNDFADP